MCKSIIPYIEIQKEHVIFGSIFRNYKDIKSFISSTTHAMDVGALTPFLGIRRTRKINEFYERVSVHGCIRHIFVQEVWLMIPVGLLNDIITF
jgi:predicted RNase H-related nuclease YkuK (DUF458 family)